MTIRSAAFPLRGRAIAAGFFAALVAITSQDATAADRVVTTPGDAGTATTCTLRQAYVEAMSSACATVPSTTGEARIVFSTSVFPPGAENRIVLTGPFPAFGSPWPVIDGSANTQVTIEGFNLTQSLPDSTLRLRRLRLRNGFISDNERFSLEFEQCALENTEVLWVGNDQGSVLKMSDSTFQGPARFRVLASYALGNGIFRSAFTGGRIIVGSVDSPTLVVNPFLIEDSVIADGSPLEVGDIAPGFVEMRRSTVRGNVGGSGGGITVVSGEVAVIDSTISGNMAAGDGGGIGRGGSFPATIAVLNSTISGNIARGVGGGCAHCILNHTTVSGNTAPLLGGVAGGICAFGTVVAGNAQQSGLEFSCTDQAGPDFLGGNPKLGLLADNGGPTQTMLPLSGSPLIDAPGNPCPYPADQRGVPTPQGGGCDFGAVEVRQYTVTVAPTPGGKVDGATPAPHAGGIVACTSTSGTCSAIHTERSNASLLLTPSAGFRVGAVSGCGGQLTGNSYGINPVAGACTVSVAFANDAPVLVLPPAPTVLEDSGVASVSFTVSDRESAADTLVASASAPPGVLTNIGVAPGAAATQRVLSFTPAADASGPATVTVSLVDPAGGSTSSPLAVTVTLVNDAPTLALGSVATHAAASTGARSVPGFATFGAGPGDEGATQAVLDYELVSLADPDAIIAPNTLDIANDGTLVYTLTGLGGTAVATVRVRDNGGVANGGVDVSPSAAFSIAVFSETVFKDGFE